MSVESREGETSQAKFNRRDAGSRLGGRAWPAVANQLDSAPWAAAV